MKTKLTLTAFATLTLSILLPGIAGAVFALAFFGAVATLAAMVMSEALGQESK